LSEDKKREEKEGKGRDETQETVFRKLHRVFFVDSDGSFLESEERNARASWRARNGKGLAERKFGHEPLGCQSAGPNNKAAE
jgi:hypothetical protein